MNHNEIKQKLMQAESVEQTAMIARDAGMELSSEEVAKLFEEVQLRKKAEESPRELSENELEAVSGGGYQGCPICKGTIETDGLTFESSTGRIVEIWTDSWCWSGEDFCYTWTCTYPGVQVHGK